MQFELGDLTVEVVRKDIKNVHLSVYPPSGAVRLAAPAHLDPDTLRAFAASKLGWIRTQQRRLRSQARETPREYVERESHYLWGKRYLLEVREHDAAPRVDLSYDRLRLWVRPGATTSKRQAVIEAWYRERLKEAALPLIAKWEPRLGVNVERVFVQRMKTRWGSCNPVAKSIRLNTELAKKPVACLEYLVVHEMAHLIEPSHNHRFVALMDRALPTWRFLRQELNRLPISHQSWTY